ncbi:MAG: hypothetical protein J7J98_09595 [candidate division Zixibacteria bacterium]|nr:hypothetical protein [candidate division Zixibacteria bacterium]
MSYRYHIVVLLLILSGLVTPVVGREADTVGSISGIEIETSVDRVESYIGDLITYTLKITYDSTYDLTPPPLGANLGAFDVKDYQPDIETVLPDGRLESRTIFTLSTYTTGDYIIPPLPVVFVLPDSSRKVMLAEPIPIKILSLLDLQKNDSVDIKPLKPQLTADEIFPPDYSKYYLWGSLGLVLCIVIGGLIFWWWRRKRQAAAIISPAWEVAFKRLAFLKVEHLDKGFAEQLRAKDYYVELTELSRAYLGRIYEIDVLEMTTEQFMDRFAEIELPDDLYSILSDFYKHADQVKFAKMMPEMKRTEDDFLMVHAMIDSVRIDYERRQEMTLHETGRTDEATPIAEEQKV